MNLGNNKKIIYFVTSNLGKVQELKYILSQSFLDIEIKQLKKNLIEIQGEPEEIALKKLQTAISLTKGPVLTEDTSLCFNSYKGLPGPYLKDFYFKIGNEGLFKMASVYDDRSAVAISIFGLAKDELNMKIFVGKTEGDIVSPRVKNNIGWDPIFQPKGFNQTFDEMDIDIKNSLSHRSKSIKAMIKYLNENPDFFKF